MFDLKEVEIHSTGWMGESCPIETLLSLCIDIVIIGAGTGAPVGIPTQFVVTYVVLHHRRGVA